MRRIMYLAIVLLLCTACTKDDPQGGLEPTYITTMKELLTGSWHGELYSETTNTTECEDLTFRPFREVEKVVSLFGTFDAYGTVQVESYINDHLLPTSELCLYTIVGYDSGVGYIVSFYPCDNDNEVIGKEDKRILIPENDTAFLMRKYGLTERNNRRYERR